MTASGNTTLTIIRRLALLSAGAAALALAGNATAAPINILPTARLAVTPTVALIGQTVRADASASTDVDGSIVRYEWDFDNNGTYEVRSSSIRVTGRSYPVPGQQTIRLRVTDNRGATATTTRTITVHRRPVALLTADRAVPTVGDSVEYRATGSFDPDGGPIIRYTWDLNGDGLFEQSTTGPIIRTTFTTPGMQRLSVIVTDSRGATSLPRTLNVRVNDRPIAVVSATPNPAVVNQTVQLSGAASTDDRGIANYAWDLDGNGSYETDTGTTPQTTTTFSTLGPARIGLQVTDTDGVVDRSAATITVNTAPTVDRSKPIVKMTPPVVRMNGRFATVKVSCPASELRCATRLTLVGRSGSVKNRVVGRRNGIVPGGRTLAFRVPLSAKAQVQVRRSGRMLTLATAIAKDQAGNVGTARRYITARK